jgi:hypothetical protein
LYSGTSPYIAATASAGTLHTTLPGRQNTAAARREKEKERREKKEKKSKPTLCRRRCN